MSIYDKASLVHIPSGVKSGTLYNVLPNNADGDFDFTRSSTATRVNKDGLIETAAIGVPRLNYPLLDGVVQDCPTLLLEPSRINIYTYSEDLSQGTTLTNTTVDADSITSPDGALTGNKLTQTSGAFTRKNLGVISGAYAWSFFAKKGDLRYLNARSLFVLNGTTPANGNTIIDLDTNTIAYKGTNITSASIQQYPNDWIKVEIVATDNATGSGDFVDFFFTDNATSTQSTGVAGNGYIWGVQFESGNYGTSYTQTSGSTSTRIREVCEQDSLSNLIGQTEGVIYYDYTATFEAPTTSFDFFPISVSDGSTDNFFFLNNYNQTLTIGYKVGTASIISNNSFTFDSGDRIKVAFAYKQNDFAVYINGTQILTLNNGSVAALSEVTLGNYYNNQINLQDDVKVNELIFYNTRLSNSELETTTSYTSFNQMAKALLYTIE